jgi:hypothetical protein
MSGSVASTRSPAVVEMAAARERSSRRCNAHRGRTVVASAKGRSGASVSRVTADGGVESLVDGSCNYDNVNGNSSVRASDASERPDVFVPRHRENKKTRSPRTRHE